MCSDIVLGDERDPPGDERAEPLEGSGRMDGRREEGREGRRIREQHCQVDNMSPAPPPPPPLSRCLQPVSTSSFFLSRSLHGGYGRLVFSHREKYNDHK